MMYDLTHVSVSFTDLTIRAVVVYLAVLLLLRVSGKRQLGQMSAIELVALLLISNAVQNAMNAGDNSLVGGVWLAAVLIFLSWLISWLGYRNKNLRLIFEGAPTLLMHRGKTIPSALAKERINLSELITMLRKQGIHHLHEVHSAILESDGTLTLVKESEVALAHTPAS